MNKTLRCAAALCSLAVLAAAPAAWAQSNLLPRQIRLVVPFPPGNASDFQARLLADQLRRAQNITAIVDNRPGASGAIALQFVAGAKPDGATLLVSSTSPLVINPAVAKTLPYDTERDFAPVALLGFNDVILLADPAAKVNSATDLFARAAQRPDDLTYASIGNGTLAHLVLELMTTRTGVKMRHVPYKGSAQAYTDLIGGQITVMADGLPQALPQVKAGKLKALAVLSAKRSPFLDAVPTIMEARLTGLSDFEVVGWTGMLAPAATPRDLVAAINAETVRLFNSTEVRDLLAAQSLQPYPVHGPERFTAYIQSEMAKWRAMARAAKVENSQ